MIVCHNYRFIFLKTRKTAGSSLEVALSRFCGPGDVLTRLTAEEEEMRKALGAPTAQNVGVPVWRYRPWEWLRLLKTGRRLILDEHNGAAAVSTRLPRSVWRDYFKFTIERNPWDKAVSLYFWRTRNMRPRPAFSDFLRSKEAYGMSNFHVYSIGGRVVVDHVIRYENLQTELQSLAARLGLPEEIRLPAAKSGFRTDRSHYSALYTEADREYVGRICEREIAAIGYSFESMSSPAGIAG